MMVSRLWDMDGLAQDYSNSSALAMELLQSCAQPSMLSCARNVIICQAPVMMMRLLLISVYLWDKQCLNFESAGESWYRAASSGALVLSLFSGWSRVLLNKHWRCQWLDTMKLIWRQRNFTRHQRCFVTFSWKQFKVLVNVSVTSVLRLYYTSPKGQWLNPILAYMESQQSQPADLWNRVLECYTLVSIEKKTKTRFVCCFH